MAHISGPMQFEDIIAAWSDSTFASATGRILGHLRDATSDEPLPYLLISAGGLQTFSDAEGAFRFEGLPLGIHHVTVASTDGAYQIAQQGAMVAEDRTTPVDFRLVPAQRVRLTFQVTVPGDTIAGVPVRVAGNVRGLGARFGSPAGDSLLSSAQMPTMYAVDTTHFVLITEAYAGTDLRYKYTLGDGLWNAERDGQGALYTRQVIVPSQDLTIVDTVSTWHSSDRGSVTFRLTAPDNTPDHETMGVQFDRQGWSEPLEMWHLGQNEWIYTLHGPVDFDTTRYRYCRNLQCGQAGTPADLGVEGIQGLLTPNSINQTLEDVVTAWRWWEQEPGPPGVVAPEITPREGFEAGVELLTAYDPRWSLLLPNAWDDIADFGSNSVILTPGWVWERSEPNPMLSFDPSRAPYPDELQKASDDARERGLTVGLRATTHFASADPLAWWSGAPRSRNWWAVWFEEYRSFAVTLAQLASQAGASKLVLGGPEVLPSLPGGTLPDGTPSDVPGNAETLWRQIVDDVRLQFAGQLAFEIELGSELQAIPPFLEAFDEIHIYWHAPLAEGGNQDFETLQNRAAEWLAQAIAAHPTMRTRSIILVVEYLSMYDGRTGCPPSPDGSCRPAADFEHGAIGDADLAVDLTAQTEALNAVLMAAYFRSEVAGFYIRGYDPTLLIQDKSSSIGGKPSRALIWYWFQRLTGLITDERP
jgi:hypothetical protein